MITLDATPARLFAMPAFWIGAAAARAELLRRHPTDDADLLRYHAAIGSHEATAKALLDGRALETIPEFLLWRDTAYAKPTGAPDVLAINDPATVARR